MILNTKIIHNSFWRNFPARAGTNAFKSLVCRQEKDTAAAVRLLRAKIVIVEFKIIIFVLNYLTVLVYTKTIIHLSVGGFAARYIFRTSHLHFGE